MWKSRKGIWWPQNGEGIHTLAGEEEREAGRPSVREAGPPGEKNHTTEGDSDGVRKRGMWATMPPLDPLDRGRGWWLLCHRQALGSVEKLKKGLSGAHSFGQTEPPLAATGTNQALRRVPERRAGRSEKPRAGRGMGFKSTFIPEGALRSAARLLVWAMELEVSTETRQ